MRIKNFKEFIQEKFLISEFNFGFELEAIIRNALDDDDFWNIDPVDIKQKFNKYWDGKWKITRDASIKSDNDKDYAFEYNSPVLQATPQNFKKLEIFLNGLEKQNIYTNNTTGFHVHISFPYLSGNDLAWIIFNISLDDDLKKKITKLGKINFVNKKFADTLTLDKIKEIFLSKANYSFLKGYLSDRKHNFLRLHPQGTLEWRGPRDFIGKKKETKEFIKLLYSFIKSISDILDKDKIIYKNISMNRKDFDELIQAQKYIKKDLKKSDENFSWVNL